MNVVWADRTKHSTEKDSRNGLGKSTLIEIIHFCMGAGASNGKGLLVESLSGWEFCLRLEINGAPVSLTRGVDHPKDIRIDAGSTRSTVSAREACKVLGNLLFGLPVDNEKKYQPHFRALISYFIRRGKDAFSTPFEYFRKQREWDKQIHNAFFLGLSWANFFRLSDACRP